MIERILLGLVYALLLLMIYVMLLLAQVMTTVVKDLEPAQAHGCQSRIWSDQIEIICDESS